MFSILATLSAGFQWFCRCGWRGWRRHSGWRDTECSTPLCRSCSLVQCKSRHLFYSTGLQTRCIFYFYNTFLFNQILCL